MKKLLLILFILSAFQAAYSQDYRRIKVGIQGGYVSPEGGNGGGAFAIQPGFRITDKIAINAKVEVTIFTRDIDKNLPFDVGVGGIGSYTANAQYYFLDGPFRPFVSFGLGYYVPAEIELTTKASTSGASQETKSKVSPDPAFGFAPGAGFDFGHLNVIIEYNIVGDSESTFSTVESNNLVGGGTTTTKVEEKTTFKNSYLALKLGFTIGGGRK